MENSYSSRFEKHFYTKTDEKALLGSLLDKYIGSKRYHRVLDVGAGPGEFTRYLEKHCDNLTIVEVNPDYESQLREMFPKSDIIIDSINNVKFENDGFDLVILSHLLYYQDEVEWLPSVRECMMSFHIKGS